MDNLVRDAGGNPFLLQALAGHGGNLEEAIASRLAPLPEPARRLIEVVAVASAPLRRAAWSRAAALEHQDALALGHLRANRLVRVRRDGTLEPYHDTLRRAVLQRLDPARQRAHHAHLADALAASGDELLALHLHGAGRASEAAEQPSRAPSARWRRWPTTTPRRC